MDNMLTIDRVLICLLISSHVYCILGSLNVALNKPTWQSSTYGGTVSSRAVDGNTSQAWYDGSCSSTDNQGASEWLCVDLQQSFDISSMKIFSILAGIFPGNAYIRGFEVRLGSAGHCDTAGFTSAAPCYKDQTSTAQSVYTIERCNQPSVPLFSARFVFVSVHNYLQICELQILTENCPDGFYGTNCSIICPANCTNNVCEKMLGSCSNGCQGDLYGSRCELPCSTRCKNGKCNATTGKCTGCEDGYYGEFCESHCNTNCHKCDRKAGKCYGCKDGYHGDMCASACSTSCQDDKCDWKTGKCTGCKDGFYGDMCEVSCSNCKSGKCNARTGKCTGCKDGYYGDVCEESCSTCNGPCRQLDGVCLTGCKDGYWGCNGLCLQTCAYCNTGGCRIEDGACHNGCQVGFNNPKCFNSPGSFNVALNKPTGQSSKWEHHISFYAVDGNTESKSHTRNTRAREWWCVDLKQSFDISSVKIFNILDLCCRDRMRGFEIRLSSTGHCDEAGFTSATPCYKDETSTAQSVYTIERCNQPSVPSLSARYVFVSVTRQFLMIREVQIFTENCPVGFYGTNCHITCPANCTDNVCGKMIGSCSNGCQGDHYGSRCELSCNTNCLDDKCDWRTGKCTGCKDGYYGDLCEESCSTCYGACRQLDGVCLTGCKDGYWGSNGLCLQTCAYCNTGCCRIEDGVCHNGCQVGFNNPKWFNSTRSLNVALNKPTWQSSTYRDAVSSRAVDGNTNQDWSGGSCSHTGNQVASEWLCVDLKQSFDISSMKIFDIASCCGNGIGGFEVRLSSTGYCDETGFISATPCYKDQTSTGQYIYTIERCNQPSVPFLTSRYVFVSVKRQYLSICELEIFTENCPVGFYGTNCNIRCPANCTNNACGRMLGSCSNGCQGNHYGSRCEISCNTNCLDDKCDWRTGRCTGCKDGYYGDMCGELCSACNGPCRQLDGLCLTGCKDGYWGSNGLCLQTCSYCNTGGCRIQDGVCNNGS